MDTTIPGNTQHHAGNGVAGTGLNKAAASVHGAVDKLAEAADKAARKVEPAIARTAQMAHTAVNKASDVAGPAADWLSERGSRLATARREMTDSTGKYVAAHPWKSVGIALAAGYLISRLVR
jgi:ElaB/YqjD/DUF883 family membrane-anchored ribosome-binding protein